MLKDEMLVARRKNRRLAHRMFSASREVDNESSRRVNGKL
jgi:hypothetical protein